jgi:uncharacterized protein YjiS (DUF1127 family)
MTQEHIAEKSIISPRTKNVQRRLARYIRNFRTRRRLAGLADETLRDIGITKSERDAEISKPFWR